MSAPWGGTAAILAATGLLLPSALADQPGAADRVVAAVVAMVVAARHGRDCDCTDVGRCVGRRLAAQAADMEAHPQHVRAWLDSPLTGDELAAEIARCLLRWGGDPDGDDCAGAARDWADAVTDNRQETRT